MRANTYDGQRMTTQRRTKGFPLNVYPWSSLTGRDACKRCVLLVWFGMDRMWWTFMDLYSSPSSLHPQGSLCNSTSRMSHAVRRCYITFNLTPHDSFFSSLTRSNSNSSRISLSFLFFRHPLSTSHFSSLTAFWLKDFLCSLNVKIRGALPVSWDCSRGEDTKIHLWSESSWIFVDSVCLRVVVCWVACWVVLNRETKRKFPLLNTKQKGHVKKCQKRRIKKI